MADVSEETQSGGSGSSGGEGPRAGRVNGKSPPRVVPLPLKREVSEKHLANLKASGLTDETIALAELYTEHNHKALAELVQRKMWPKLSGAALVFPFYLPDGTEPFAYRVRPTNPRKEKRGKKLRDVKYDQAEAHGILIYFAPRARAAHWYADTARTLLWTEGEKKALVLDQLGHTCVGLTGVWNWIDRKHKESTGEERLHSALREQVGIAARHHVICFDADALDNDQVMLAAARLCGVLRAAGALSVRFVCPPTPEQKGIDDFFAEFGPDVTLKLLESARDLEPADPKRPLQRVKKVRALRSAPVSDELCMPEDYMVQKDGTLWHIGDEKHGDVKIARSTLLLQRYLDDYYTHEGRVELVFDRDGTWVPVCVGRKAIVDNRTMVSDLAPFGAPVTSNNAVKLVDWIEDFERVNAGLIPRHACVARAGWHAIDGERVFVLNEPVFEDDTRPHTLAIDTRGDRRKLFGALKPRGDGALHLDALRRAWAADPVVAAVICGALAATLLEPLGAPNFAIHLPGDSSRGKTSMLKVAASVFGDPNNESWVASWNTTGVAAELRAATLTDLPQCYDEVGASDAQQIERMVYMLVNGGGRSRSTRDLTLRETPSWRTVVLSTGERELADQNTATGAQIRVIHLPVGGFGDLLAAEVDELRESCIAHAGSFGRLWVENLLGIDDWEPYREALRTLTKQMRSKASDALEGRVAAYFGVLAVAEAMAAQIGLGASGGATMQALFFDQGKRETVQAVADRALGLVLDWVTSEPEAFPELEYGSGGDEKPTRSYGGRPLHGFRRPGQTIFIPDQFRAFCDGRRLSSREVLRGWAQRGWLDHDQGRLEREMRIAGKKGRFYVLKHGGEDE